MQKLSSVAIILLFAWQPFRGEYRIGVALLSLLGLVLVLRNLLYQRYGDRPDAMQGTSSTEALRRLAAFLLCFLMPSLLSLGTSLHRSSSLEGVGSIALSMLFGTGILAGMLNWNTRQVQQIGITVITTSWIGVACLVGMISVALMGHLDHLSAWAPFFSSSRFGRMLTALLPVALWRLVGQRNPLGYGLLIAAGVATILTGQRNNLLGYVMGACLLTSQLPRKVAVRILAIALATLLAVYPLSPQLRLRTDAIVSGLTDATPLQSQRQPRPQLAPSGQPMAATKGGNQEPPPQNKPSLLDRFNRISSERGYIYEAAFRMWLHSPLTGIGANAFKEAYPTFADPRDAIRFANPPAPHSVYVGIVAQTGVIGLAGLATALVLLIRWGKAAARTPGGLEAAKPYAASLVVMLFPLITQDDFFDSTFSSIFIYMACGLISASLLDKTSAHPQMEAQAPDRHDPSIDQHPENSE